MGEMGDGGAENWSTAWTQKPWSWSSSWGDNGGGVTEAPPGKKEKVRGKMEKAEEKEEEEDLERQLVDFVGELFRDSSEEDKRVKCERDGKPQMARKQRVEGRNR